MAGHHLITDTLAATGQAVAQAAAPVGLGTIAGLTAASQQGPWWLTLSAITASLMFGLVAAAGQSQDQNHRQEARRLAMVNAGALWLLCVAIAMGSRLGIETTILLSLGIGFAGSRPLRWLVRTLLREE